MTTRTVARTCNLCEAMCGVLIEVDDASRSVVRIEGDRNAPLSQGYICPKAAALKDIYDDPDRLRMPMRRTGNTWKEVSWDDALDEAADRIVAVQEQHGSNSVGVYFGNPNVHNLGAMMMLGPFSHALRSRSRFSASSLDQWPTMFAAYFMYGHQLRIPVPDLERTDYALVLGANPVVSNGSLMSTPNFRDTARKLRERGGKLVVVDPRRTRTADEANEHIFVRPGGDVGFLLSLLHEVVSLGTKHNRLSPYVRGLDTVQRIARQFPPERTERSSGVPVATVQRIARELVTRRRACVYGRMGVSTQEFGGVCAWLIQLLNLVTGNLDEPGGVLFARPAVDLYFEGPIAPVGGGSYGRWRSRVRGLAEFGGELPSSVMAEEILTEGKGQIRGMVTIAGNPVLSSPNGQQLERAFASLETYVAIDYYLNESTRHAHLLLPPVSPIERSHYDLALAVFASKNAAVYSPPVFERLPGQMDDGGILSALQIRLLERRKGRWHASTIAAKAQQALGVDRALDLALRAGPYGAMQAALRKLRRRKAATALSLDVLKKHPSGLVLSERTSMLPGALPKNHKYIDAAPELFVRDMQRVASFIDKRNTDGLVLIGRRELRSNNSWMHNAPSLMRGRSRCTALMHPNDATARNIASGDRIRLTTTVGTVDVVAEIDTHIMQGVVSLPHGYGHKRTGVQLSIATRQPGVSFNDLTDDQRIDTATGNAAWFGTSVHVEAIDPEQPTPTANPCPTDF